MHYTPRPAGMKLLLGQAQSEFTQYSNYLWFVHKLCMGIPSFDPYHWCAVSPQCVFLYSLALSCTRQLCLLLAGMSSSSLPFPVVCESQFRGCRIVHHWPVPVGQVQRYVQSTCTPITVCTIWVIVQVKQKEPNTLTCILILLNNCSIGAKAMHNFWQTLEC